MAFGQELKQERERRGIALEDVAAGTKVSVRHLEALERDDLSVLPSGVFSRGIVQSYCRHLGLNEEAWLAEWTAAQPQAERDWSEFAEAVKRSRVSSEPLVRRRWWGVLAMLIALAALGWAAWHFVIRQRVGHTLPATGGQSAAAWLVPVPCGEPPLAAEGRCSASM